MYAAVDTCFQCFEYMYALSLQFKNIRHINWWTVLVTITSTLLLVALMYGHLSYCLVTLCILPCDFTCAQQTEKAASSEVQDLWQLWPSYSHDCICYGELRIWPA